MKLRNLRWCEHLLVVDDCHNKQYTKERIEHEYESKTILWATLTN